MWTQKCAEEITEALRYLPLDKVFEARDFVRSLRERYGYDQPVDEVEDWTEEDLREAAEAAAQRLVRKIRSRVIVVKPGDVR